MVCPIPIIKLDKKYNIVNAPKNLNYTNLNDLIDFEEPLESNNKKNVLSHDDADVCYKLFVEKQDEYYFISLIDISEENMIIRKTSHDIRNIANTINSFLFLSKKVNDPKIFIPQLEDSKNKTVKIAEELDKFATRKN